MQKRFSQGMYKERKKGGEKGRKRREKGRGGKEGKKGGREGGKSLLFFMFRHSNFLFSFLLTGSLMGDVS